MTPLARTAVKVVATGLLVSAVQVPSVWIGSCLDAAAIVLWLAVLSDNAWEVTTVRLSNREVARPANRATMRRPIRRRTVHRQGRPPSAA